MVAVVVMAVLVLSSAIPVPTRLHEQSWVYLWDVLFCACDSCCRRPPCITFVHGMAKVTVLKVNSQSSVCGFKVTHAIIQ